MFAKTHMYTYKVHATNSYIHMIIWTNFQIKARAMRISMHKGTTCDEQTQVVNIHYPLVIQHSYWKLWFIVDLPIENGGSFHSCADVYQRVNPSISQYYPIILQPWSPQKIPLSNTINVGIKVIIHPPVITIHGWYFDHFQSWVVYYGYTWLCPHQPLLWTIIYH